MTKPRGITTHDPEYWTILDYCKREGKDGSIIACPSTDGETIVFSLGPGSGGPYRIPANPNQKVPTWE